MALDPTTLDSETPRTTDGRSYPDHLRVYEQYDEQFLPTAAQLDSSFAIDDLLGAVERRRLQATVPRWLASAEWRGLVERRPVEGRRLYALTARATEQLDPSR